MATGAFSKIKQAMLFSSSVYDEAGHIRKQIDEDNRKSATIWSVVEIVFWIVCLALSLNDESFERCRIVYIVALVLAVITLVWSAVIARKVPKSIPFLVIAVQLILLGVGIGLVFFQPDVRSATFIAAVLLVPVMFVCDTLPTAICVALGVVCFAVLGSGAIAPEVYSWTLKSLVIFSISGLLVGYIINKARFERYAFAESAMELAELRNRFAYYDQLSGLQNRRACSEKISRLSKDTPTTCCVIMADINGLKQTNDAYGHGAGDEMIVGAAECLSKSFEGIGEVYRLGGDEFCVIAMGSEDDIANRLQQMEKEAANWCGKIVKGVSISYGVATAQESSDIDELIKLADRKMYDYKRNYYETSGRDRRKR